MNASATLRTITVALIGNPNTGKSTLFSGLAGVRQRTGNYPGVTVEKKVGQVTFGGRQFSIVDLPGTYSLAPRSPDEMIAVDVLLGRQDGADRPDVVLCIVDASNLERNLYLVSQVLELGLPTVLALNMVDASRNKGLEIDVSRLQKQLGVPVVETQANKKLGLDTLKQALAAAVDGPTRLAQSPFPEPFCKEVAGLEALESQAEPRLPRYLVERLLLDTSGYLAGAHLSGASGELLAAIQAARGRLAAAGCPVPAVEAIARYKWVGEVLQGVIARPEQRRATLSDRVDRLLTHRILGTLVFVVVMAAMFQAVFLVGALSGDLMDWLLGLAGDLVAANLAEGALRSLLVTGVIGGVGGVLVFLPQILTLFFFIAVLEDCGYMARAAYLMDKLMSRVGLSGKSFIPLLSSFACAIPGIMSTRVIENRRDRLVTILVAPLMSCSARLPVYVLLIGAFVPDERLAWGLIGTQGLTMLAMYSVGALAAVVVALVLKRTLLKGPTPPFVMELPSYKVPGAGIVLSRMLGQGWSFVRRAGTLIFAVTIVVWAAAYYPRNPAHLDPQLFLDQESVAAKVAERENENSLTGASELELEALKSELSDVENRIEGAYLEDSYLGRAGHFIEPAVKPLGWDWRIGCAAIASFPAREVVVATLGVIYNLGEDQDENSPELAQTLQQATWHGTNRKVFNLPVALSIMVFFALCAQCASTLVVMKRETNSWAWPAFTFVYMTTLAYLGALATYQIGTLLGG